MLAYKPWESEFLGINYYSLELNRVIGSLHDQLKKTDFDLVICDINLQEIISIQHLESVGFRTVDSRITFLTLIDLAENSYFFEAEEYVVRTFEKKDLEKIIALTHSYLTDNPDFVSRYKNLHYFKPNTARRYFETWIINSIKSEKTTTIVAEIGDEVVGYFIIEDKGFQDDFPLLKGVLTTVEKNHRGKNLHLAMQSKIYKSLNCQKFYLDNTTQLSNIAVIKNHIKSNRKLSHLTLTMMLKKNDLR